MTVEILDSLIEQAQDLIVSVQTQINAERDHLSEHGESAEVLKALVEVKFHLSKGHLDLVRLSVPGNGVK
jgi:hypothetical protein